MEGSELALTSVVLAALGAAVYFVWSGSTEPSNFKQNDIVHGVKTKTGPTSAVGPGRAGGNRKMKKRKTNDQPSSVVPLTDDPTTDTNIMSIPKLTVQRSEATVPGGFGPLLSASEMESAAHSVASSGNDGGSGRKKKKSKKSKAGKTGGTPTGSQLLAPPSAPSTSASTSAKHVQEASGASEFDSESGWTRITRTGKGVGKTAESASDAGVTTSVTEEEGSVASKRDESTFAEKMLPKPAKTVVDDMIDGPKPGIARVLRVPGGSASETPKYDKPAEGLTWEDYEDGEDVKGSGADADEEDSTWDVVTRKRRGNQTPSTYASDAAPSTIATSTVGGARTKKQRQNDAKREADKAAKLQAEKEQQAALEKHRRARIEEQYQGKGKSGGMKMVLDPKSGAPVFE